MSKQFDVQALLGPNSGSRRTVKLIADPEGMNKDRAQWAMKAIRAFQRATRLQDVDGLDTAILDLLCDLAHLCDKHDLSFEGLLRQAHDHYNAETLDEGQGKSDGHQLDFLN